MSAYNYDQQLFDQLFAIKEARSLVWFPVTSDLKYDIHGNVAIVGTNPDYKVRFHFEDASTGNPLSIKHIAEHYEMGLFEDDLHQLVTLWTKTGLPSVGNKIYFRGNYTSKPEWKIQDIIFDAQIKEVHINISVFDS